MRWVREAFVMCLVQGALDRTYVRDMRYLLHGYEDILWKYGEISMALYNCMRTYNVVDVVWW